MTSNLWPLLRVQLKTSMRTSYERMTGTNSPWGTLLFPLFGLAFIPLLIMFAAGWVTLYFRLALIEQQHLTLVLALSAGQLISLAFGVLYVISVFYFGKDLPILVPLPLRPGEIVLAKFVGILMGEYVTMAPVVLPALAIYGLLSEVGPLYIPMALVIYLMLPVVPLVISALFTLLMMRLTSLPRNRDLFRVLGALLGIGLALTIQFISRMRQGSVSVDDLLTNQQPLIQGLSQYLVTSAWATDALKAGSPSLGLPPFLLFLGVVGVALVILVLVAEAIFFGGLLGSDETRSAGPALRRADLVRETSRVRSAGWAVFVREVRLLNRNPSFLTAAIFPPLMIPFFTVLPLTQPGGPLGDGTDIARLANLPHIPVIALGAMLFVNSISTVSASAISREGRWFWISQSLPVMPRVQVQAKLLHSLLFYLVNLAVLIGAMLWVGLATPRNLVVVLVGGLLTSLVTGYSGLLIDVIRPSLNWTDPQQAMKSNLNSVFALMFNLILGGVIGLGAALLYWLARPAFLPGVLVILGLLALVLGRVTVALADRRYMEYE